MNALPLVVALLVVQDGGPDAQLYLSRIAHGDADEVRSELPSLLSKYPNNPGVIYLQGVLTADGTEVQNRDLWERLLILNILFHTITFLH